MLKLLCLMNLFQHPNKLKVYKKTFMQRKSIIFEKKYYYVGLCWFHIFLVQIVQYSEKNYILKSNSSDLKIYFNSNLPLQLLEYLDRDVHYQFQHCSMEHWYQKNRNPNENHKQLRKEFLFRIFYKINYDIIYIQLLHFWMVN